MQRSKTSLASPVTQGNKTSLLPTGDGRLSESSRPVHPILPDYEFDEGPAFASSSLSDEGSAAGLRLANDDEPFDEAWFGHPPIVLSRYLTSDDGPERAA